MSDFVIAANELTKTYLMGFVILSIPTRGQEGRQANSLPNIAAKCLHVPVQ